eukprot:5235319-Amphidinium_carterae.1
MSVASPTSLALLDPGVKKLQVAVAKKDLESRFVRGRFIGHVSRSATALISDDESRDRQRNWSFQTC